MRRVLLLAVSFTGLSCCLSNAQKVAVSTNLIDYACLGTLNMDVAYSVAQHWSLHAYVKYNPFTFNKGEPDEQFQYRQQSYALGTRFWPWHSFSGWWIAGRMRYQEFNAGGIFSDTAEEGDRVGLGLSAGYTVMISRHFNVEFGIGAWSGLSWFRKYSCPVCGLTLEQGHKWFIYPDDIMISFSYVF